MSLETGTCVALRAQAVAQSIRHPEVIVPANVDAQSLANLRDHELMPYFVDIHPGLYVLRAQDCVPEIRMERTVGLYAPSIYGNTPELAPILAACAVHDMMALVDEVDEVPQIGFAALYEALAFYGDRIVYPERCQDIPQTWWTCFPFVVRDAAKAPCVLQALTPFGAQKAHGCSTSDALWHARLPGAMQIETCGIVVPLDADPAAIADALDNTL